MGFQGYSEFLKPIRLVLLPGLALYSYIPISMPLYDMQHNGFFRFELIQVDYPHDYNSLALYDSGGEIDSLEEY